MTKKKQVAKQVAQQVSEQVSETLGYAVIAREEGARLGDVTHVFFDVETKRISGMTSRVRTFAPESWFGVDQIEVMGKDVILLKNEASLTPVGKGGVIEDAKFKTYGCGSAIASSSLVTEWVKGKTVEQALDIKNTQIAEELALPPVKIHCSILAEDAIKAAVQDYQQRHGGAAAN